MRKGQLLTTIAILVLAMDLHAESKVRITTWNIEHLGSDGRGFGGGFGSGSLPLRSDAQLAEIGGFIKSELQSTIVAIQEVSFGYEDNGKSRSVELDKITEAMGSDWLYYLPPKHPFHTDESMYSAFLWNSKAVRALRTEPLGLPIIDLAGKALFDRIPIAGYFEIIDNGESRNDFLLVNVHLASEQSNDENHLIAMTLIEYVLFDELRRMHITESDRIILGDFNDNPYATHESGAKKYTDALYRHMEFKRYIDFVTSGFPSTRMDSNLESIIDHVLINTSAQSDVIQSDKAVIWLPPDGSSSYGNWRRTYSDHFPVSIDIRVVRDEDADWSD